MKIEVLEPKGYCAGVTNAISVALKAKIDNPQKKVYVLGNLVHNNETNSFLLEKGIITLDSDNPESTINGLNSGDVLVFPAHGHDPKLDEVAKSKGLTVYDATCPVVKANMATILSKINDGYKVIFIGKKNHPETKAMLSLNHQVFLYDDELLNNNQISTNDKVFVANQTTLNYASLSDIYDKIKSAFRFAEIQNEVCAATRLRQEKLKSIDNDTDLIIVVGSSHSNNTKELYEIALANPYSAPVILIDNVNDLMGDNKECLQNKNHIVISSGASTPKESVDMIKDFIINNA